MPFKKYQIAKLFAYLVLVSSVSCTKSVNMQFGKKITHFSFQILKYVNFNLLPQQIIVQILFSLRQIDLKSAEPDFLGKAAMKDLELSIRPQTHSKIKISCCIILYLMVLILGQQNENIIEELYSQGTIEKQVFYINIDTLIEDSYYIGSIDIGNPNYFLIGQGSKFTLLKNDEGLDDGYYATCSFHFNYGDIQLIGYESITFTFSDPFIRIPGLSLNLILQEFKGKGIEYLQKPEGIFINSIEKLERITIEAIDEDGSVYSITLNPQQYSGKTKDGQYQLLLKPIFLSSAVIIGYSIFQANYVGSEFTDNQIYIVKKDSPSQSHI